ncbi:hypothetical protein HY839_01885 [Candidatus Azambacteria bacterium]|nr:hypothetical protein [Candidatus Azambacteria bacterium]
MKKVSRIILSGHKLLKQKAREILAIDYDVSKRAVGNEGILHLLESTTVGMLDRKVKHGENLSFEEAFCGMCYVLAATNAHFYEAYRGLFERAYGNTNFTSEKALAIASSFLSLMAAKESLNYLTAEEIAGMVAAGMMDTVISLDVPRVVETCGMGGDKGFRRSRVGISKKTINVSTLSALVLSAIGLPAAKHGSYANTSAVGSTEAIELFGAKTSMISEAEVLDVLEKANFCFFDAHWCKTIHDLSHLLMMETINHVIGPMTPPFSSKTEVNKLMGVNEKIHPKTVAEAYAILHQKRKQNVGGVIIVCGLDEKARGIDPLNFATVKKHAIVDEVSPYVSVVSATLKGEYLGTWMLSPEDFGVSIDAEKIQIVNKQEEIQEANIAALSGANSELADYLAVNAALGLYAAEYLSRNDAITPNGLNHHYLRECFRRCRKAISSGAAKNVLDGYVRVSKNVLLLT